MILGIAEDFSLKESIVLDSELKGTPTSGLYANTGLHPSVTVGNLVDFLPKLNFGFKAWDSSTAYAPFLESKDRNNIVKEGNKIYQSILAGTDKDPDTETTYWLETNIESLKLKVFLESVRDKVLSDLNLTKRLINNQFIYENGDIAKTLPNDYAAWVFEPKGSDYVAIKVNQISLQKTGTTPINLYVINEGTLVETITDLTPNEGKLNFQDHPIVMSGKGRWYLAIDSTDVIVGDATIDPLRFDGFVAYTATGVGAAPETAEYDYQRQGNGIGLNISAYLDSSLYVTNNISEFGNFIKAAFEFMVFQTFQANPNNRSNRSERLQLEDDVLLAELKRFDGDTVVSRYYRERKRAIKALEKTFDTQLSDNTKDRFKIRTGSV